MRPNGLWTSRKRAGRFARYWGDDFPGARTGGHREADRRGRFFFHRARKPAQELVRAVWMSSDRTSQYLGEWHTHPEADPAPSDKDLTDWKRLLRVTICEHSSLFFVIVGLEQIRVWEGNRVTNGIARMTAVSQG